MNKRKRIIEQAILLTIDSIREDICETVATDENKKRAEAIKILAEAYTIVRKGKLKK